MIVSRQENRLFLHLNHMVIQNPNTLVSLKIWKVSACMSIGSGKREFTFSSMNLWWVMTLIMVGLPIVKKLKICQIFSTRQLIFKSNNMITEDYVSFETAKLLKEKGFDEGCGLYYAIDKCLGDEFVHLIYTDEQLHNSEINGNNSNYPGWICTAPTLQMATKWLREVHHLVIDIKYQVICPTFKWRIYQVDEKRKHTDFAHYQTYEEACEAAIKYCLESLI